MKKTTKASKPTKKAAPVAAAVQVAVSPATPTPAILAKPVAAIASPATTAAATTAAAPAKAAPAPVKSAAATTTTPVTIEAKIDVGFGNKLFVRGQGGGLSWERGLPLENVDSKTWRLIVPAQAPVQFKLLINDSVWAQGEDLVAAPGKKIEVTPAF
jgi:hypothetical protein